MDTNNITEIDEQQPTTDLTKSNATDTQTKTDNNGEATQQDSTETDAKAESEKAMQALDKLRAKMKTRIGAEASKKNEFKAKFEDSQKQVEKLSAELDALRNPDTRDKQDKNDGNAELDKANKRIADLEAEIARGQQVQTAYRQMNNELHIPLTKDMISLAVPKGATDDEVTANLKTITAIYYAAVGATQDRFLVGKTPKDTGTPTKQVTMDDIAKEPDQAKRLAMIKQKMHKNN